MNVENARQLKRDLEQSIEQSISVFQQATGLGVDRVHCESFTTIGGSPSATVTVEQAAVIERLAELTARVEALEAAADGILWPERKQPPATASSLVERLAKAAYPGSFDPEMYHPEIKLFLMATAAWIVEQHDADPVVHTAWEASKWLEWEANRG